MQKRLSIALLGMLIFTVVGARSFANSPLWNVLPDVVIGDAEDNTLTLDNNLFRYVNAFNVLDKITTNGTDSATWQFSFYEETTHNDISINGVNQLSGSETPSAPPAGNQFQTPGYWLTFRDILRSPESDTPPFPDPTKADGTTPAGDNELLPWQNTPGSDALTAGSTERVVTLYVYDQVTQPASKSLVVMSVNNGMDELTGGATTIFTDALTTIDKWTYVSAFTPAPSSGPTGLGLESQAGQRNFGRWEMVIFDVGVGIATNSYIDYVPGDQIYCARLTISYNSSARSFMPPIRMGAQNGGQTLQILNLYNSIDGPVPSGATEETLNPQLPDPGTDAVFTYYWSSHDWTPNFSELYQPTLGTGVDARTFSLFIDLFDDDPASVASGQEDTGVVTMKYVEVRTIERPATIAGTEITDLTSGNGFGVGESGALQTANVSVTENSPSAGMITFSDAGPIGGTGDTYLVWEKQDVLQWQGGVIARVTAWVSCPTTADRTNFHRFRIRHQHNFLAIAQVFQVRQNFADQGNPMAPIARDDAGYSEPTHYETYIHMRGGPSAFLTSAGADQFLMSLDQLHNTSNLAAGGNNAAAAAGATQTTVHKVLQELLPIGQFSAGEN